MVAKKATKKIAKSDAVKLAVAGASLAGLAATAYFFFGPKGKKRREQVKSWAIKMKGEVIEKLETAKEISEPIYHEIIDRVSAEFKKAKKAGNPEIEALAADLKKHWKSMSKLAMAAKDQVAKDAAKVAKTAKASVKKANAK